MQKLKSRIDPDLVLSILKDCLPGNEGVIQLHEPYLCGNEWKYVKDCLDTGWVSSAGSYVKEFEIRLSEYTGVRHAVACVNGTTALQISFLLAGIKPGDEVIVPALTFVATANAVTYVGAEPHFADSEERTLGIDPLKLDEWLSETTIVKNGECINRKTGKRIKAVVAVHVFGHPVDLDSLLETCQRFKLELIEDAAEALGSFYKDRHVGQWGCFGILSFNGNKTVTTGGGGALLTNDGELAKYAKHLTTTARISNSLAFYHDQIGYNFRLPNLNAALGCAQLEQLPTFINKKRALAERYERAFANVPGLCFFKEPEFAKSNYWLNAILLDEDQASQRDPILELTNRNNIATRPTWTLMHKLPMYQQCQKMDLSEAENLERRLINIPSSAFLYD